MNCAVFGNNGDVIGLKLNEKMAVHDRTKIVRSFGIMATLAHSPTDFCGSM